MRLVALASVFLLSTTALAHSKLNKPDPINPNDDNKVGTGAPCGAAVGTPIVNAYQVGSQVDVSWYETIDHQGGFEIRFAANGDTDCTMANNGVDPAVAGANVPNKTNTAVTGEKICPTLLASQVDGVDSGINRADPATWKLHTMKVTMPAAPCTNCIIQLIQWMGASATPPTTYTAYHSCARINLTTTPPPDMAGTAPPPDLAVAAAPADMAVASAIPTPDLAMPDDPYPSGGLGCSMAAAPTLPSSPAWLLMIPLALLGGRALQRRARRA